MYPHEAQLLLRIEARAEAERRYPLLGEPFGASTMTCSRPGTDIPDTLTANYGKYTAAGRQVPEVVDSKSSFRIAGHGDQCEKESCR
jgi:hypothetical protein